MDQRFHRRDLLRLLGAGAAASAYPLYADESGKATSQRVAESSPRCPAIVDGKVIQPQRELPVLHETDVLVVGGGAAGVCAALAARRAGAKVCLVERYGHFGGLWSGGLVLIVLAMYAKDKRQVTTGLCEEILQRLDKIDGGVMNHRPGSLPTVDAEALKYVMVDMVHESEARVFLHCWGVDAILEGQSVRGAVFESKSGRQAVLAKVVVDATGDGDIFAAAGAEHDRRKYDIGLVSRLGALDKVDPKAGALKRPIETGNLTPIPGVRWVNMRGPVADGLDVAELSRLEMNHRRLIWKNLDRIRKTPGYEKVFLAETAPQLGVRITRCLGGVQRMTLKDSQAGIAYPDVIGYGGIDGPMKTEWQIPFGALLPTKVENLLAAGRCISGDQPIADIFRLIAPCCVTGQAAGVAAALAAHDGCRVRELPIAKLQEAIRAQGAYVG